jgi:hypothetical protein
VRLEKRCEDVGLFMIVKMADMVEENEDVSERFKECVQYLRRDEEGAEREIMMRERTRSGRLFPRLRRLRLLEIRERMRISTRSIQTCPSIRIQRVLLKDMFFRIFRIFSTLDALKNRYCIFTFLLIILCRFDI